MTWEELVKIEAFLKENSYRMGDYPMHCNSDYYWWKSFGKDCNHYEEGRSLYQVLLNVYDWRKYWDRDPSLRKFNKAASITATVSVSRTIDEPSIAFTIYNMSHTLMVPLSTRNTKDRGGLSVFNNIASVMISGIIVALIFPMVIMPMLGANKQLWITVMSVLSIITLPLTLVEYYFTKERVTEESEGEETEVKPILEQLKAVVKDRYWVVIIAYYVVYSLGVCFKNSALVYYCNYVLGTYNDGITQMLVSVIGGVPMGIGIFAVGPLAKKFGKRNLTLWGFVLYAIGGTICLINPRNMVVVLIGQFIKNIGGLPCAYVFMALFADVLDHIEWKYNFRVDGLSTSIYTIIATVCVGVASGVMNLCMANTGYIAPEFVETTGETVGAVQNLATQNVFIFFFLTLEIITGIILVFLLRKLDVEKTIDAEQAEIKARREAK
jgi:GPH family glycoside/pentoside/hexuronide:cation symporter